MKLSSALARIVLFLLLVAGGMAVAPATAGETGHDEGPAVGAMHHAVAVAVGRARADEPLAPCEAGTCVVPCATACCAAGACGSALALAGESTVAIVARHQAVERLASRTLGGVCPDVEHGPPRHRA